MFWQINTFSSSSNFFRLIQIRNELMVNQSSYIQGIFKTELDLKCFIQVLNLFDTCLKQVLKQF